MQGAGRHKAGVTFELNSRKPAVSLSQEVLCFGPLVPKGESVNPYHGRKEEAALHGVQGAEKRAAEQQREDEGGVPATEGRPFSLLPLCWRGRGPAARLGVSEPPVGAGRPPGVSEPPVGAGGLAASFPQSVSWGTGACLVLCGPWFHVSLTVAFRGCVLLALLCSQLISLSPVCFTRPTSMWSEGPGCHIFSEQGSDTVLSRGPTGVSRVTAALLLMARGPHAFLVFSEFPSFSVLFKC